jgi:phage terminase large subunit-like protein
MARQTNIGLHPGQFTIFQDPTRFKVVSNGRRWGKSALAITLLMYNAQQGKRCAYLAPNYDDFIKPFYNELYMACAHLLDLKNCRKGKFMKFKTGGTVDFYSSNSTDSGRGRKFHLIIVDEAGHSSTVGYLPALWELALRPTLVDFKGSAIIMGTPTGNKNYFYALTQMHGWKHYHAPTSNNPFMSKEELNEIMLSNNELVWRQEYLAEFVDWDENAVFNYNHFKIVPNIDYKEYDTVYITCDTAIKGGSQHDGTAICIWGTKVKMVFDSGFHRTVVDKLTLLDWDLFNLDGNMIESKLIPVVEDLKTRSKFVKIFIEDKGSGSIVIQNLVQKYGSLVYALGSEKSKDKFLTHYSKGDRALACTPFTSSLDPSRRKVEISEFANEKKVLYKNQLKNHLKDQLSTFNLHDNNQADDCVDAFCYGVLVSFYKK